MRNLIPLILSASLIGLTCLFMLIRMNHPGIWDGYSVNVEIIFVLVYLLWIMVETKVSKEEVNKGKTSDYGNCELYALGQAAVILSALWQTSAYDSPNVWHVVGFIIFITGIAFRQWAVKTLGQAYSHLVRNAEGQVIVDSGPYSFIRHPAYAGMIMANLGVVIFFFNMLTLILFLFLLIPAIILRIFVEEKTLFQNDAYRSYAQDRPRLIPGIW